MHHELEQTVTHTPRFRTQWPMDRDLEHIGPCTETYNTAARALSVNDFNSFSYHLPVHRDLAHTSPCTENENTVARAPRLSEKWQVHQDLGQIRPCAKTSNTASAARPRMPLPVDQDLERSDPCANI